MKKQIFLIIAFIISLLAESQILPGNFPYGIRIPNATQVESINMPLMDSAGIVNTYMPFSSLLRSDVADTKTAGDLTFDDNVKIALGTGGAESDISSDGIDTNINLKSGNLSIQNNGVNIITVNRVNATLGIGDQGTLSRLFFLVDGGDPEISYDIATGMYFNAQSGDDIRFADANSVSLLINGGGNVSIGNTNDTYKLDVTGTGRFTGEVTVNSNITQSSSAFIRHRIDQTDSAYLETSVTSATALGNIDVVGNGAFAGLGTLRFLLEGVERARINTNGNFSLGNTNDTYKLDVSGTGRFTGDVIVPADTYNSGWDGDNSAAPKNDVYDKIETLPAASSGTFSPTLVPLTSGSYSYTTGTCKYTKVGNLVFVTMTFESISSTSPVGALRINFNLPFSPVTSGNQFLNVGVFLGSSLTAAQEENIRLFVNSTVASFGDKDAASYNDVTFTAGKIYISGVFAVD